MTSKQASNRADKRTTKRSCVCNIPLNRIFYEMFLVGIHTITSDGDDDDDDIVDANKYPNPKNDGNRENHFTFITSQQHLVQLEQFRNKILPGGFLFSLSLFRIRSMNEMVW